jgi:hypothetical protein
MAGAVKLADNTANVCEVAAASPPDLSPKRLSEFLSLAEGLG